MKGYPSGEYTFFVPLLAPPPRLSSTKVDTVPAGSGVFGSFESSTTIVKPFSSEPIIRDSGALFFTLGMGLSNRPTDESL